jgi:hypothetical protein
MEIGFNKIGGSLRLDKTINTKKEKIKTITFDGFIRTFPEYANSKLFKVDTDGYDNKILRGAEQFLKKTKPAVFFEYDKKYLTDAGDPGLPIFDYLADCGYQSLLFYDNIGRFIFSCEITDKKLLSQIDRYLRDRQGICPYVDIVAFHRDEKDIANSFINFEERMK